MEYGRSQNIEVEMPDHAHLNDILNHVELTVKDHVSKLMGKVLITFFVAIVATSVAWGVLQEKVSQNEDSIEKMQNGAAVYLTRTQVEDLLAARDQRLISIESSLERIERTLGTIK